MIPLIIAYAILFAWACIATGVAIANDKMLDAANDLANRQTERVAELEDAARATSLAELRTYRPTAAMEASQPEPERHFYAADPTGLIVNEVEIDPRNVDF